MVACQNARRTLKAHEDDGPGPSKASGRVRRRRRSSLGAGSHAAAAGGRGVARGGRRTPRSKAPPRSSRRKYVSALSHAPLATKHSLALTRTADGKLEILVRCSQFRAPEIRRSGGNSARKGSPLHLARRRGFGSRLTSDYEVEGSRRSRRRDRRAVAVRTGQRAVHEAAMARGKTTWPRPDRPGAPLFQSGIRSVGHADRIPAMWGQQRPS